MSISEFLQPLLTYFKTPDTPPESLETVLKTALEYGTQKVLSFGD